MTAQKEVIEKFHWLHNKDEDAKVGVWCPISFADAPDCTKRRTVLYSSQLDIPAWLQKVLGGLAAWHAISAMSSVCRSRHACNSASMLPAEMVDTPQCRVALAGWMQCRKEHNGSQE